MSENSVKWNASYKSWHTYGIRLDQGSWDKGYLQLRSQVAGQEVFSIVCSTAIMKATRGVSLGRVLPATAEEILKKV